MARVGQRACAVCPVDRHESLNLTSYWKGNVSAYRATDPKRLRDAPVRCSDNLFTLLPAAGNAERVVLAFGTLTGQMRVLAEELVGMLRGVTLWCLGTTADGSPRHPLYLRADTPLTAWGGWK